MAVTFGLFEYDGAELAHRAHAALVADLRLPDQRRHTPLGEQEIEIDLGGSSCSFNCAQSKPGDSVEVNPRPAKYSRKLRRLELMFISSSVQSLMAFSYCLRRR